MAAGEVVIRKKSGKGAQNVFHDIPLRLTWGRGAVVVQDTHGYSRKPGRKKRKGRECIHIRMDYSVVMISYHFIYAIHKGNRIFIVGRHFINSTTHSLNFWRNVNFIIIMDDEIELYFCPVDVFIIIHNDSLYAASSHNSQNLQYPYRFSHSKTPSYNLPVECS